MEKTPPLGPPSKPARYESISDSPLELLVQETRPQEIQIDDLEKMLNTSCCSVFFLLHCSLFPW